MRGGDGQSGESVPVSGTVAAAEPMGAAKRVSLTMLVLGVVLFWPVPLAGCFFLVVAGLGLAISSEVEMTKAAAMASDPTTAPAGGVGAPFDPSESF